jgi:hypothetical protein
MQHDSLLFRSTAGPFVSFSDGKYLEYEVVETRSTSVGADMRNERVKKSFDTVSIYYVDFENERFIKLDTGLFEVKVLERGSLFMKKTGILFKKPIELKSKVDGAVRTYDTILDNGKIRCFEMAEYLEKEQDTLITKYYFFQSNRIPTILDYLVAKTVGDEYSLYRISLEYKRRAYIHSFGISDLRKLNSDDMLKYKYIREIVADTVF